MVPVRNLALTPACSFANPFQGKSNSKSLGRLKQGKKKTKTTGQCANRSIKLRSRGGIDLLTPLPGMPLGRATSHLSPGEPVCMRPTQWTRREASEYSQGREHLPPSAVEKLCGDKSRAECHCACVVCPNPQPRTQSQNSAGSRKDPSLLFLFSSGVS